MIGAGPDPRLSSPGMIPCSLILRLCDPRWTDESGRYTTEPRSALLAARWNSLRAIGILCFRAQFEHGLWFESGDGDNRRRRCPVFLLRRWLPD